VRVVELLERLKAECYDEKRVVFRFARIPKPDNQQRRLTRTEGDLVADRAVRDCCVLLNRMIFSRK
jgi:hypothetical protein